MSGGRRQLDTSMKAWDGGGMCGEFRFALSTWPVLTFPRASSFFGADEGEEKRLDEKREGGEGSTCFIAPMVSQMFPIPPAGSCI